MRYLLSSEDLRGCSLAEFLGTILVKFDSSKIKNGVLILIFFSLLILEMELLVVYIKQNHTLNLLKYLMLYKNKQ